MKPAGQTHLRQEGNCCPGARPRSGRLEATAIKYMPCIRFQWLCNCMGRRTEWGSEWLNDGPEGIQGGPLLRGNTGSDCMREQRSFAEVTKDFWQSLVMRNQRCVEAVFNWGLCFCDYCSKSVIALSPSFGLSPLCTK